jgi:DNA-binding response OmpR family regulator
MALILLVEDDEWVRGTTAELIRELGHQVVEADSAESAMLLLRQTPFDVLVVDIGLPGVSGEVFAAQARSVHTAVRIIFATGGDTVRDIRDGASSPLLLRKPYDIDALAKALAG